MGRPSNVLRRTAVTATLAAVLAGAGVVALAEPAAAAVTVSGDVVCNQGTGPVVGVWIQAAGGSGWASGTSVFSKSGVTPPWTVHVGCGGSPSNWQYAVYGVKSISATFANWGCYPFGPPFQAPGCYTPAS
ncbi:hypothetical protein Daura_13330 [Dactylosporangium aurantiacum]|uniref:Secreted protein n=1 Tax=Dactylosporangium aurantiacum TaxID=35754 RepID=A0A9Q9MLM0_9ACTN|nr:hypothetical protein [Dactylosporangium aurantiacum]MDG6105607.1 hypothetical protein [Dactylosporangium aurantiacum]UWZ57056.1 hypothetical protein Daura_13330 [Dactylosporangium aurantiacum]